MKTVSNSFFYYIKTVYKKQIKNNNKQHTMSKGTSIKDALKRWEEKSGKSATDATDIQLQFQWPPVEKMDSTLSSLKACEKLSLSSNMIEKITGINGMKNLKILSLARNHIKSLQGIESLSDNLEELWVSYNMIEKIKVIEGMKALKVLYIGNNMIKDWVEFNRMSVPPNLVEVLFVGNPLHENMEEHVYRAEAIKRLPNLKKLDGDPVV